MIKKYQKKPVVVEAVKFTDTNKDQIFNWITCNKSAEYIDGEPVLNIQTLEGVMIARLSDYIIKGVQGEFYACKPDIFEQTYQEFEELLVDEPQTTTT